MDRHNWLCCKWVNNNVLPSIFNIPHLPKSKIFVCSHVLKEDFSNLNTHLTKASEQYCPHPPVWGPGSTVRGEQWMCYSTVGWVPPACAPPTMTTHICYILNRHFCAHSLLWSSLRSLALSVRITCAHDWLYFCLLTADWGGTILLHHHREFNLTFVLSRSRLGCWYGKSFHCLIPVQLSSPRLILPVRGACVHPRSMIPLYRVRTDAHSPRMATRSPRLHPPAIMWTSPPFLPPLFPLSHPTAAGRPDSYRIPRILLAWRQSYIPETVDGRIWNIVDTISSPWQPKEQKGHFLCVY